MKTNNPSLLNNVKGNVRIKDSIRAEPKTGFGATLAKKSEELRQSDQAKADEEAVLAFAGEEMVRGINNAPKATPLSDEKSDDEDSNEGW